MINEKLIGRKLHDIRKDRGITIQQLSKDSGISVGYISMVERGRSNPSLGSIQRLCAALNVTLMELLNDIGSTSIVVHAEDRVSIGGDSVNSNTLNCQYESLTNGKHQLSALLSTHFRDEVDELPPIMEWPVHASDEFGFILQGKEVFYIGDEIEEVSAGDALLIPANTPHYSKNTSDEPCISLWVYVEAD